MRLLVVASFEITEAEQTAEILRAMQPKDLPYFAGEVRLVIEPVASQVTGWLDDEKDPRS